MHTLGKAFIYSFSSQYVSILIQLLRTTILARLIAPEDFGTFALSHIVLATAIIIQEFGINSYLIKEKDLNQNKIRSAYGLLIIIASISGLMMFLSAGYVAEFYQKPDLAPIIQLLTISIFLSPLSSLITALLNRAMNFRPSMIANLNSLIIGTALMIYLALKGFGVYALVGGSVCQSLLVIAILQFYRPTNAPLLPKFSGFGEIFHYSKFVSINSLVVHFGSYIGEVLTGKHFAIHAVGILNRASNTAALFNQFFAKAFMTVVTPYISQLNNKGHCINETIKKITNVQLLIAWPFFAFLALSSDYLVYLLFGEQWLEVAPLLTYFAISRLLFSFTQLIEPIFIGIGKASTSMKLGLSLNILKITVTAMAAPYGINAMVLTVVLVMGPSRLFAYLYYINKELHIKPIEYLSWAKLPFLQLIIFCVPITIFSVRFDDLSSKTLIMFFFISLFSTLFYLLVVYLNTNGKQAIEFIVKSFKNTE